MSTPKIEDASLTQLRSFGQVSSEHPDTLGYLGDSFLTEEVHSPSIIVDIRAAHPPQKIPNLDARISIPSSIISDDFPERTPQQLDLANIYRQERNMWESIYHPSPLIPPINEGEKLQAYEGLTGLSNPTGRCAMNASLQSLRFIFKTLLEQLKEPEKKRLEQKLADNFPELLKFIRGECLTEKECTALHKEHAHAMAEDFWFSFLMGGRGISQYTVNTGHVAGHSAAAPGVIASIYLHRLEAPKIYFQKSGVHDVEYHSIQTLKINGFLCRQLTQCQPNLQELVSTHLALLQYKLIDPLPPLLVMQLTDLNPYQGSMKPIMLAHEGGSMIAYFPKLIKVSPPGHDYCFIQEKGNWYEVNDSSLCRIPLLLEKELEHYCDSQNVPMIVYTKDPPLSARVEKSNEELVALLTQLERSGQYPPRFLIDESSDKSTISSFLRSSFLKFYQDQGLRDNLDKAIVEAKEATQRILEVSFGIERIVHYEEAITKWNKVKDLRLQQAKECARGKKLLNHNFYRQPLWEQQRVYALSQVEKAVDQIQYLECTKISVVIFLGLKKIAFFSLQEDKPQEASKQTVEEAMLAVKEARRIYSKRKAFLENKVPQEKEALKDVEEMEVYLETLEDGLRMLLAIEKSYSEVELDRGIHAAEQLEIYHQGEATEYQNTFAQLTAKKEERGYYAMAYEASIQQAHFWAAQLNNWKARQSVKK